MNGKSSQEFTLPLVLQQTRELSVPRLDAHLVVRLRDHRQGRVSHLVLELHEVGALAQHVRDVRVTQEMRKDSLIDAGGLGKVPDQLIDSAPSQRDELAIAPTLPTENEFALLRAAMSGEVLEPTVKRRLDIDVALTVTLADHAQPVLLVVAVLAEAGILAQRQQFTDSHTGIG